MTVDQRIDYGIKERDLIAAFLKTPFKEYTPAWNELRKNRTFRMPARKFCK
jgi:hypothetical protein